MYIYTIYFRKVHITSATKEYLGDEFDCIPVRDAIQK